MGIYTYAQNHERGNLCIIDFIFLLVLHSEMYSIVCGKFMSLSSLILKLSAEQTTLIPKEYSLI